MKLALAIAATLASLSPAAAQSNPDIQSAPFNQAPPPGPDPLANYYGNTLISEKLSNISPYGGAAHVWLNPDRTFVSFDVTTGGRSGKYSVTGKPGAWQLCMGYSFRTICYPIDPRKVGETWVIHDPDALSLNSLVPGHQ